MFDTLQIYLYNHFKFSIIDVVLIIVGVRILSELYFRYHTKNKERNNFQRTEQNGINGDQKIGDTNEVINGKTPRIIILLRAIVLVIGFLALIFVSWIYLAFSG